MNFEKEALQNCRGISIHWSADCNMACQYCYIDKNKKAMHDYNMKIREAIQNGTFISHIKNTFGHLVDKIEDFSLWGAEPTINGDLFKPFIYECLDFFSNIKSISFSSNALLGGDFIYDNFFIPLMEYAEKNHRELIFDLQLSLDGPPEFNDISRHPGATENTLQTAYDLLSKTPRDCEYFKFAIVTKATLDISYMRIMVNEGLSKFQWYYDFMNQIQEKAESIAKNNPTIIGCQMFGVPTLVDPGYYTKEDGECFAKWINYLPLVSRDKWSGISLRTPLFTQCLNNILDFKEIYNPHIEAYNRFSCSSGKNNYTIDCDGSIYSCNRLCRNAALDDHEKYKGAMKSNSNIDKPNSKKWLRRNYALQVYHESLPSRYMFAEGIILRLAKSNQIDIKYLTNDEDRLILFYMMSGFYCHVGSEEDFTGNPFVVQAGFFRLLGNGAQYALENYYRQEKRKGIF